MLLGQALHLSWIGECIGFSNFSKRFLLFIMEISGISSLHIKWGYLPTKNKNRIGWFTQQTSSFLVVSYSTIPIFMPLACMVMSTLTEPTTAMAGVAVHTTPMLSSTTCIIILWVDGILFLTFSQNQTGFVLTFQSWDESGTSPSQHIRFLVLSRPMHAMSRQRHASDLEQKPLQLFSTGSSHQIN